MGPITHWCYSFDEMVDKARCLEPLGKHYTIKKRLGYMTRTAKLWFRERTTAHSITIWDVIEHDDRGE